MRRLPLSSFGKSSIAIRLIAQWIFLVQAIARGLLTRGLAAVMVSTSPPFAGVAGVVIGLIRRCKVIYWVMDLNPDQMIALGLITERSLRARIFRAFNRAILRRADDVVVLDRFMAERVNRLADVASKMAVMPPWPHEDALEAIAHANNPFRQRHGLEGKFVVMYSGNHSPANPITTALDAAQRLESDERFVFFFIGGGTGKKEVDDRVARGAKNVRSLPYQPLAEIKYSLSAADVHVVSIGDGVVGIVHPCKVYGAMAVGRPHELRPGGVPPRRPPAALRPRAARRTRRRRGSSECASRTRGCGEGRDGCHGETRDARDPHRAGPGSPSRGTVRCRRGVCDRGHVEYGLGHGEHGVRGPRALRPPNRRRLGGPGGGARPLRDVRLPAGAAPFATGELLDRSTPWDEALAGAASSSTSRPGCT